MRRIRALIADDETFARDFLRRMLAAHADVEVVADCADGAEAAAALRRDRPDVAFLDIRMPLLTGTQALDGLDEAERPLVVFCTAHDEYALRAFDYAAADYLLKPFDADALARALDRVRARLGLHAVAPPGAASAAVAKEFLRRIVVRQDDRLRIVAVEDLHWVGAEDKWLSLHTANGVFRLRRPIRELEAALDPQRFARIHRSTLVALAQVRELHPLPDGDYGLVLAAGPTLTVSRGYRDAFFARLDGRHGGDPQNG
jgi:two-component system LytT family response regulator